MAPRTLPGLGLSGFWTLGEDGWNTGADQNWLKMSAVTQLSVISRTTALPGSPSNGDIYIVPAAAVSEPNKVAVRDNGAWVYMTPQEGWRGWVRDADELVVFDGAAWVVSGANVTDDSVTNAKLANMATARIKGRTTAGTGDPEDLTGTQVTGILDDFVGSGASNKKGLVPAPGATAGNTRFLNEDGTWQEPTGLAYTAENVANKGVAGGYASLDGSGKVPAAQLPSYVDDVLEYADLASFPATGESGKIYIAADTSLQYRWSGSAYVTIVASPGSSDAVTEGSTNLYFTQARVRNTTLAGYAAATVYAAIAASDTILEAFGKIGKRLADLASIAFSGSASDLTAGTLPAARFDDTSHGARAGGTLHAAVTTSVAGFMSASDKSKLDGISPGASTYVHPNHSGDVTSSGDGATTIAADAVTNAKLANMATARIKGRVTAGTGDPEDLTGTQVTAVLDDFVGSGASNKKGLVPAPGSTAGTARFLNEDGTWKTLSYDMGVFIAGKPLNSELVCRIQTPRSFSLPINLSGSYGSARVASSGTVAFDLLKNGVSFGTLTFTSSGTGVFTAASATSFAAGDILTITAPASADATLEDISINLKGSAT